MLIGLTVETSGQGSYALESLTAHKITTFRCEYLATMATGNDDDDDEDGATTTTKTTTATARRAMGYNDDGGG
jgi:flagellar motor component MotA